MTDNLKDLIDKAEQEERTQSELQKTIDGLKLENATLRKKVKDYEDKTNKNTNLKLNAQHAPDEIDSLKKVIASVYKELEEKANNERNLVDALTNLKIENDSLKESLKNSPDPKILNKTKNALDKVLDDYQRIENMNDTLSQNVKKLENENFELNNKLQRLEEIKLKSINIEKDYNLLKIESKKLIELNKLLKNDLNKLKSEISVKAQNEENNSTFKYQLDQKISEIQRLQGIISNLKSESLRLKKFETIVPTLETKITQLKQQKDMIKGKDSILLAKTITAMSSQQKGKLSNVVIEPKNEIIKPKLKEPILFSDLKSNDKLKILSEVKTSKVQEKVEVPEPQKSVQELIAEEISNGTSSDLIKRKWQCPYCGNIDKSKIREIPDKSRIIFGSLYGKKYKCGLCANEWN